jgi:hypothetical protein
MIIFLTASLLVLAILVLAILIQQGWTKFLTLLLIPFLIFNIGFSWFTINELWGTPRLGLPAVKLELLHAAIRKPFIYILAVEPDSDKEPVLYKIPYSKQTEEKLAKAGKKLKKNQRVSIEQEGKPTHDTDGIKLYDWDHKAEMPK